MPTSYRNFLDQQAWRPGEHPAEPTMQTAAFWVTRRRAAADGYEFIPGSCFWAMPGGMAGRSAYERMRTARGQEAATIRAQGLKEAQIIRANAQGQAAQLYAASFGKDPQFYDFYRAMQSYRTTFLANPQQGQQKGEQVSVHRRVSQREPPHYTADAETASHAWRWCPGCH